MKAKTVKALMVEPNKHPCVVDLNTDLDSLQKAVGGLIEFVWLGDNVEILCNDEGKIVGLPPNRRLHSHQDIICGTFYIVSTNPKTGELISLTPEQQEHYTSMFYNPDKISKESVENTIFFRLFKVGDEDGI